MTEHDGRTRVLLRPEVTEERVEEVALDLDWIPLGTREASETGPYEQVWEDEVTGTYVHYVWDDLLRLAYLLVHGADTPAVERAIRGALPTFTYDEVLDELRTATEREPTVDAICRMAVLRPTEDPQVVRVLLSAADSADTEIRRAFITATGYLGWSSLLERVGKLRDQDPDVTVREDATLVLDAMN